MPTKKNNTMKYKLTLFLFLLRIVLFAQEQLPIIKSTSNTVDIRDGLTFKKGQWNINSDLKPDTYITTSKNSKVTFYTDLDSISFNIKPNKYYDFNILLNEIDTAFTRIIYAPTYLEILKGAKKYNLNDSRKIPKFSYQSKENENLKNLNKKYNLDSIAGQGNEVSQIINLLHWVHYLIPHDGNSENPQIKNAMSLINECKILKRGLNCRGLATVLNESYLSLGFKSRIITCIPKDSLKIDNDVHVINMVFAKSLKKWLWIDPTNNAYVMDEKAELLSIEEVREKLINDKPLFINPDANWNRKESTNKEWYLYNYMAKNLYMLECPVESEFDLETNIKDKEIKYIRLIPLDYFEQLPDSSEYLDKNLNVKFIKYKTNHPALFWKNPED
jgi:hypothetical protein